MKRRMTKDNLLSIILMVLLLAAFAVQIISCTDTPAYAQEPVMPIDAQRFILTDSQVIDTIPNIRIWVLKDTQTDREYLIVHSNGIGITLMPEK